MTNLLSAHAMTCFEVDELLSRAEAADRVRGLEARGFSPTGLAYPPSYRDNDRLVFDDHALAAALFERLRPHLPGELERQGATWRLVGLNERFRACRYRGGQRFAIHRDGPHTRGPDERSWLTVMLYLNDAGEFSGGLTRFFAGPDDRAPPTLEVAPRAGTAIVFDHALWHEGAPVVAGTKWVLRTDVLYARGEGGPEDAHAGYVWQVVRCADGSLVSGSRDGAVRRWPRDGGEPELLLRQPGSVTALLEHPPAALWAGGRGGELSILRGGALTRHQEEAAVLSLQALPGGEVAVGTAAGRISLRGPGGAPLRALRGHDGWVWALAWSGGRLCSAGEDGTVRAWEVASGACEVLAREDAPVRALAALDDELVWGTARGAIRARDRAGRVREAGAHAGAVRALLALPGGRLASAGEDARACVWGATGLLAELEHDDFVTSLALLADGRIATGSYDGRIRRWRW